MGTTIMAKVATASVSPVDDLLGDLLGDATEKTKSPTSGGKVRPVIQPENPEEETVFNKFAAADAIMKIAEGSQGTLKTKAHEILRKRFVALCLDRGSRPENPKVNTSSCTMNYIIKHVKKFSIPQKSDGTPMTVDELLDQNGFGKEVVDTIKAKVIKTKVNLGLKKFTDLNEGNTAEKAVAAKLMAFVRDNLTPAERSLVLEKSTDVSVDECWQDVAVSLALADIPKNDPNRMAKAAERLDKLYRVIAPQFVLQNISFTGALTDALKDLQSTPEDKTEKVFESPDKLYKAICTGKKVALYLVKVPNKDEQLVGTKDCDNPGHAQASAKKWFRNADALKEAMANFSSK
jgi:hypothetical protein